MSIQNSPHFQKVVETLLGAKQGAKKSARPGLTRKCADDMRSRLHLVEDLGPSSENQRPLVSSDRPQVEALKRNSLTRHSKVVVRIKRKTNGR